VVDYLAGAGGASELVAIAGAIAAEASGVSGLTGLHSAGQTGRLAYICGLGTFFVLGLAAALGLSARVQSASQVLIGQAHAGVLRYALALVGIFAVLTFSVAIARIEVRELLVSDIGLTYVRLETEDGPALLPNMQALAAVVLAIPAPSAAERASASPATGRTS
jgi:hypothetical protein